METLVFNIKIKAPKETIWKVLWDDETYRKWTNVFCEGTYAVSEWDEGDKIFFLTPNGEGMNSIIEKKIPNEYMAFKHISEMKNFEVMPIDEATEKWTGSMETYRLKQDNDFVNLEARMDILENYSDYFKKTFPNALEKVKQLSEENK